MLSPHHLVNAACQPGRLASFRDSIFLPIDPSLQVFRIAISLGCYLRCSGFDFAQITGCEFNLSRLIVLGHTFQLGRTWNRHDPWLPGKKPREGNLRGCCIFLFCDFFQEIDEGLIRFEIVCREAWNDAAEVGAVEFRLRSDLPCQKSFTEGAEWDEPDPEFFKRRDDLILRALSTTTNTRSEGPSPAERHERGGSSLHRPLKDRSA